MTETQKTPANLYADAVQAHVGVVHKIDGLRTAVGLIIAELDGTMASELETLRTARLDSAKVIVDGLEEGSERTPLQHAAMADVESGEAGEAVIEKAKEEAVEDKEEVAPVPQVDAGEEDSEEEDSEEEDSEEEDSEVAEVEAGEETKAEATPNV